MKSLLQYLTESQHKLIVFTDNLKSFDEKEFSEDVRLTESDINRYGYSLMKSEEFITLEPGDFYYNPKSKRVLVTVFTQSESDVRKLDYQKLDPQPQQANVIWYNTSSTSIKELYSMIDKQTKQIKTFTISSYSKKLSKSEKDLYNKVIVNLHLDQALVITGKIAALIRNEVLKTFSDHEAEFDLLTRLSRDFAINM